MVDLDKQFAAMADVSEEDTAYDFVIDEDLRVIAVPERGVVLGVEGDKDVNQVRFRINRHYRGTDLSGFNIRINYRSAEDEINYFTVTEKTVADDAIYFVWLVGADTVAVKGTVYFVARFFTAEEDGTIIQEFNTTLGNARTLEGLVVDAQADDKPVKDLLAQLEYDLKTYTVPFVQQANTYAENSSASADRAATYAADAETSATSAAQSAQSASADANSARSSAASAEESANRAESIVSTDKTLSVEGAPADAKAVGDALKGIKLPVATATTLGGVKVGSGLTVNADGTLSADSALAAYPVGSIFETVSYASPASMFGGIWEEIAPDRVLMGASSTHAACTTVEAGLPNITGSLIETNKDSGPFRGTKASLSKSGALKFTEVDTSYGGSSKYSGSQYNIEFDASLSNPIYGASDTVQPPAYIVHIWERMGYLLNINSTPGCTLTITDGKTTVEDVVDDSGRYSRELPSTGTWTITASKDESVSTKTCAVNTYGVYTVDISLEIFGVVWNYGSSSTALTRLTRESDPYSFVSTNITSEPAPAVGASYGTSPFDKYMPWKGMEEYNIVNSVVGVKQGEQGFSRTNDTVVLIPEFYYKVVDDAANKKRYFYISSRYISGFEKHPGSGRYVGKYNTASGYVSKTGLAPLTNITRATARTESMAKGSGWYQYDYASWCAIGLLYIIEYADWDTQSKIGKGYSSGSSAISSGGTDSMTYHTGRASGTDGATAVQYRHIENPWGNVFDWVDGVNFRDGKVYVCTDPAKYADDTSNGYTNAGTRVSSNGYISALGASTTAPWAIYPSSAGGSKTTYIPDYSWTSSGWLVLCVGGGWDYGSDAGLFCFNGSHSSSYSYSYIGARLMFIPSKH